MPNKKPNFYIQFLEYMISGGVYFWVGSLLLDWLYYSQGWKHGAKFWWATMLSNAVGWTVNYMLQRHWVFSNDELAKHKTQVTGRYIFITLVDFVLNYFILLGLRNIGVTPAIGQFISAGLFTPWNYLWYRFWVFPQKGDELHIRLNPVHLFAHRPHGHSVYHRS